jgi:hypothetical protein
MNRLWFLVDNIGLRVFGRFKLIGSLIFGEIKFLLNIGLTLGEVVITLLVLEGCADLALQLFRPFLRILDVRLQPSAAFLKTLHDGLQRTDGAECRVCDPRAVTVFAMQHQLDLAVVRAIRVVNLSGFQVPWSFGARNPRRVRP